jgi:hypothetical protein
VCRWVQEWEKVVVRRSPNDVWRGLKGAVAIAIGWKLREAYQLSSDLRPRLQQASLEGARCILMTRLWQIVLTNKLPQATK